MDNYILRGRLEIKDTLTVKGTFLVVQSENALNELLSSDNFKDIMEITNNSRSVDNLTVNDLVLISFDCDDKSELYVMGNTLSSRAHKIL
tara:strand:- start:15055 stop:15324 length:270 start_codon:yes stop_codon:yes gene_type:complete